MIDAPAPRRLADLYRATLVTSPVADIDALLPALDGRDGREVRDEALSLALQNPLQAALLRTVTSLRGDAEVLHAEVGALRRRVARQRRPVWTAMAASLALAAVVAFGLRPGLPAQPSGPALADTVSADAARISAISFEGAADRRREDLLFTADFDS